MTTELQAAATKLHADIMNLPPKETAIHDAYILGHRDARHAAAELVAAFTASMHPADDAEPITGDWLQATTLPRMSLGKLGNEYSLTRSVRVRAYTSGHIVVLAGAMHLIIGPTRGRLRHLLAALGVNAKEPGE